MLWWLLFVLFYFFLNVTAINLTYIVRKDKGEVSPSCIAEELERYAGIGWIYPIPSDIQELPNVVTKYIPTIENDFNCKFSENGHCNTIWSLRDWRIDHDSSKTKELLTDSRWEDLPTILISNTSKEFEEKIELENNFKTVFSIRADGLVEILICSGWNPYNYPCYYFHIDYREIYFNRYLSLPKDIKDDYKSGSLENYKAYSNILADDEWRNFILSSDTSGSVKLIDVNQNRTLIEHSVKEPLNSLYMFMRSANNSLWKIHRNSFLHTNTTQISRLGPQLTLSNRDLCISMFVKTCKNCQMSFFYMNATRKLLKTVGPTFNEDWVEIKLKEENTQYEKLNIFVETKYLDSDSNATGFWAIDSVRFCNENEVKVSFLILNSTMKNLSEDNFTCQVIKKPSWRPKKLVYDQISEFPDISSRSSGSSIHLKWPQEDPNNSISYFIFYGANDICSSEPYNPKRLKSNGFVSTKLNEILLDNLVPYTVYNVTVSTILHEFEEKLYIHTLETVEPTLEELPSNIKLRPLDTLVNISWEVVNCSTQYGRLAYTLIVSNSTLKFSKEIAVQTITNYEIDGLTPFTHYTLTILTARNGRNLYRRVHTLNYTLEFMTKPGLAPPPQNLEIYAMDKNSASLRYDLPSESNGIIKAIQVSRCNSLSFSKCKSSLSIIRRCSLWPEKYCAEVNYLIPFQPYTFRLSLKNQDTPSFGKEASVKGFADDRIPAKPTNITFKIVNCPVNSDCCDLNVTWLHPYYQNGTITAFEMVLNDAEEISSTKEDKYIHEMYSIANKTYYYDYTYQMKCLPYSNSFNLKMRSVNNIYKSDFAQIHIRTDNLGDHIDQNPKLLSKTDSTLIFKIPDLDSRLQFYTLTAVVQNYNKSINIDSTILKDKKVADHLCHQYGDTWISQIIKVDSNKTENVTIENTDKNRLEPNEKYCITFIVTNQYKGSEHSVVYYERVKMLEAQSLTAAGSSNHLYLLLLILLVVPIGFLLYRYCRKKRLIKKPMQTPDHVYETLPGDEISLTNGVTEKTRAVSNNTYT